jgi:hypothetical protein
MGYHLVAFYWEEIYGLGDEVSTEADAAERGGGRGSERDLVVTRRKTRRRAESLF